MNQQNMFTQMPSVEAEKEHYNFLNEISIRLNIDREKLINLEARITCNERT
jgi:hypothetical protein